MKCSRPLKADIQVRIVEREDDIRRKHLVRPAKGQSEGNIRKRSALRGILAPQAVRREIMVRRSVLEEYFHVARAFSFGISTLSAAAAADRSAFRARPSSRINCRERSERRICL